MAIEAFSQIPEAVPRKEFASAGSLTKPEQSSTKINRAVHGLRGTAALSVLFFHTIGLTQLLTTPFPFSIQAALGSLQSGVELFFMISGYLISGSIIRHASARTFLLDRVARIYPVFLFLHLLLFALAPFSRVEWLIGVSPGMWLVHFFGNLILVSNIFKLPLMQLNAWSLSVEMIFYLVSAAVYKFWSRGRAVALFVLFGVSPALIAYFPPFLFFVVGTSIFFLLRGSNRFAAGFPRLGLPALPIFIAIMGYALLPGHLYACWIAAPFGFAFFLDVVRQMPPISIVLTSRVMQFLGTISYSLYLWHPIVTGLLRRVAVKLLSQRPGIPMAATSVIFVVAVVVVTVPVSWLSWRFLEVTGSRWLKAKFKRLERPAIQLEVG